MNQFLTLYFFESIRTFYAWAFPLNVLMRNLQPESMPEHLKNAGYLISHGCKYIFKGEKKWDTLMKYSQK